MSKTKFCICAQELLNVLRLRYSRLYAVECNLLDRCLYALVSDLLFHHNQSSSKLRVVNLSKQVWSKIGVSEQVIFFNRNLNILFGYLET